MKTRTPRDAEQAGSSYTKVLQVGRRVLLQILEGDAAGTYLSSVVKISRDGVQVKGPAYQGRPVNLRPETSIRVNACSRGGVYEYAAQVVSILKEPEYQLVLSFPESLPRQQIQRREFERFTAQMAVDYEVLVSGDRKEAQCRDLSGTGIALVLPKRLPRGTNVDLYIRLSPSSEPCYAQGKVVRVDELPESTPGQFETGIRFELIRLEDQQRILEYLSAEGQSQ